QHGEEQSDDRLAAGDLYDGGDELGSQTGGGDATGHDTSHGAGHSHGDGALAASLQGVEDLGGGDAVFLIDNTHQNGDHDGHRSAELHGLHVQGDHDHQNNQGQQQVNLGQQLAHLGQLLSGN